MTIVGGPGVGKYTLVCRLVDPAQPHSKQSSAAQLWHLNTKYYTTQVQINRQYPSTEAQQQAGISQGLVLVFAATSEATFLDVSRWAEQLPDLAAEIRLCIANKVDQLHQQQNGVNGNLTLQRSSWLQEAAAWCAEHQFEYIEASSTDSQLDSALVYDEQSQGVNRVRSALEANYWPGLVMKQPQLQAQPEQQQPQLHMQPKQQNGHANGHTAPASNGIRHEQQDAASPSDSDADLETFNSFQSAEEADLDQYEKIFGELRGMIIELQLCLLERHASDGRLCCLTCPVKVVYLDLSLQHHQLMPSMSATAFCQVKSCKNGNKHCFAATRDRIQDLPREQRQSAAADMALRIAAVLGLEEEDSSDEEHAGH